jgi:hypothetical protein
VCDKICIRTDTPIAAVPGTRFRTLHGSQIIVEPSLENSCTEAALEHGVMWSENGIRRCLAGKTSDQVGSRVDELTA